MGHVYVRISFDCVYLCVRVHNWPIVSHRDDLYQRQVQLDGVTRKRPAKTPKQTCKHQNRRVDTLPTVLSHRDEFCVWVGCRQHRSRIRKDISRLCVHESFLRVGISFGVNICLLRVFAGFFCAYIHRFLCLSKTKIFLVFIQDFFVLMCVNNMIESWQIESWYKYEVFLCSCISPIRMYGWHTPIKSHRRWRRSDLK